MDEEEDDDAETAEAARTYGNGSKKGRGLRKAITPNRNLTYESHEFETLKEKNESNIIIIFHTSYNINH